MATMKEIKGRITSVKNTKKITKAMELVAASKMRKAVAMTLASRDYAELATQILDALGQEKGGDTNPLMSGHVGEDKGTLAVLITSDRGLCGAYNSKAIKQALSLIKSTKEQGNTLRFVAIGKKAEAFLGKMDQDIVATFNDLPDYMDLATSNAIAQVLLDEFLNERVSRVMVIYTDYKSAIAQIPRMRQIMPLSKDELSEFILSIGAETTAPAEGDGSTKSHEYLFEPNRSAVLGQMLRRLSTAQLYQMLLESKASEQSARMMAMKNASEAADEMAADLQLVFNKARQAGITQEIAEISAGSMSMK